MGIFYNKYNHQRLDTPEILTALRLLVLSTFLLTSHVLAIPNSTSEKHTVQFHSSTPIGLFCSMIVFLYLLMAMFSKVLDTNTET